MLLRVWLGVAAPREYAKSSFAEIEFPSAEQEIAAPDE